MGGNSSYQVTDFKEHEHLFTSHLKKQYGFSNPKILSRVWSNYATSLVVFNNDKFYLYYIDSRFNFRLHGVSINYLDLFKGKEYLIPYHLMSKVANNTQAGRKLLIG